MPGADTTCQITILDEDCPGIIGIAESNIKINKSSEGAEIVLTRTNGSDGMVSCMLKTEQLTESKDLGSIAAVEFEDFIPVIE